MHTVTHTAITVALADYELKQMILDRLGSAAPKEYQHMHVVALNGSDERGLEHTLSGVDGLRVIFHNTVTDP